VTDVSVVVPTHNRRHLLELSLGSVLGQRHVDLEVIVVDDGSAEDTARMLRRFEDRVRVIRHDHPQGVSAARNHGIAEAHSKWVAFLDDDDLWAPAKLERQLEALNRTGRHWAYTGAVEIAIDNRVLAGQPPPAPEEVVEQLLSRNMLPAGASNVIVEKAWLPTSAVFDGTLSHSADWDLWIRLARQGPPACVSQPLVAYRFHPGSASLDLDGMLSEAGEIEKRHGGHVDRRGYSRYLAKFAKRAGWNRSALRYYCRAAVTRGGKYSTREFAGDVLMLFSDLVTSRLARFGMTHPTRLPRHDPHAEWKKAALQWIDELVVGQNSRSV
jgi:glycosyltransferase involved in cell wall biosynthesis